MLYHEDRIHQYERVLKMSIRLLQIRMPLQPSSIPCPISNSELLRLGMVAKCMCSQITNLSDSQRLKTYGSARGRAERVGEAIPRSSVECHFSSTRGLKSCTVISLGDRGS